MRHESVRVGLCVGLCGCVWIVAAGMQMLAWCMHAWCMGCIDCIDCIRLYELYQAVSRCFTVWTVSAVLDCIRLYWTVSDCIIR